VTVVVNINDLYASRKSYEKLQDLMVESLQGGLPVHVIFAGRGVVADYFIPFSRRQPGLTHYKEVLGEIDDTIRAIRYMLQAEEEVRGALLKLQIPLEHELSLFVRKGSEVFCIGWPG
jgi:hypothetical protein